MRPSSGVPIRFMGTSLGSTWVPRRSVMAVTMVPCETALTLMPESAAWSANILVIMMTPAFETA